MLDPARIAALAAELEWLAAELRASLLGDERSSPEPDGWVSEVEVAELAGITPWAMQKNRKRGKSPHWRTIRGRIFYRKADIPGWLRSRRNMGVRASGLDDLPDTDTER